MHHDLADRAAIELLPTPEQPLRAQSSLRSLDELRQSNGPAHEDDLNSSLLKDRTEQSQEPPPRRQGLKWLPIRDVPELLNGTLVLINSIPIVLLSTYAPRLSSYLGSLACLPNGNFILPGTASIWNPEYIFTISITVGERSNWSYTHVKLIDIIWDIVVGRGGQVFLIYVAYRVYSASLAYVMETQAVSFSTYGAVSFQTGSFASLGHYLSNLASGRFPATWRSLRIFLLFVLTTLYIVSFPTLFSAMTGYASVSAPSIEIPPHYGYSCEGLGNCTVINCGGPGASGLSGGEGLQGGWGYVGDPLRFSYIPPFYITIEDTNANASDAKSIVEYYGKYKAAYDAASVDPACHNVSSLVDCPATNIPSTIGFAGGSYPVNLEPPLLDINLWGINETSGIPNFWVCKNLALTTASFNDFGWTYSWNVTSYCTAGSTYQWGFSFLLLFIVCVLNFFFAATMYGLWIEAHRHRKFRPKREKKVWPSGKVEWRDSHYPSMLSSATNIVRQAEKHYGDAVTSWSSRQLDDVVWRGKKGMRALATDHVNARGSTTGIESV